MKAVLISIQPKWCELIASGKKTVEVRKTAPKIATPFKVYIYCTSVKAMPLEEYVRIHRATGGMIDDWHDNVIGEFVCRNIDFLSERDLFEGMDEISNSLIEEYSCLSIDELLQYKGKKEEIYGWHISDLVIYDNPKELSEFSHTQEYINSIKNSVVHWEYGIDDEIWKPMKRPPQSWCYVEELR